MLYEQCVRKKLRSLFEYLDTDGDGIITQQCLLHGLARLHSHQLTTSSMDCDIHLPRGDNSGVMDPTLCEYSIEELIRAVPSADEKGGITLQSFLDAEETVLPRLTHLKLLQ